jgi:hypothetical protein
MGRTTTNVERTALRAWHARATWPAMHLALKAAANARTGAAAGVDATAAATRSLNASRAPAALTVVTPTPEALEGLAAPAAARARAASATAPSVTSAPAPDAACLTARAIRARRTALTAEATGASVSTAVQAMRVTTTGSAKSPAAPRTAKGAASTGSAARVPIRRRAGPGGISAASALPASLV